MRAAPTPLPPAPAYAGAPGSVERMVFDRTGHVPELVKGEVPWYVGAPEAKAAEALAGAAEEARFPAAAALRSAKDGRIVIGRNHFEAAEQLGPEDYTAEVAGHPELSGKHGGSGFVDATGIVRPGETIPQSAWMSRSEGYDAQARLEGRAPGRYATSSEGLTQGVEYGMQHERQLASMNLLRADQGLPPMSRAEFRTKVLGQQLVQHTPGDAEFLTPKSPGVNRNDPGNADIHRIAAQYREDMGIPGKPPALIAKTDPAFHGRIAQAYEQLASNPNDPEVQQAYGALRQEVAAQHQAILDAGYRLEPTTTDPYKNSAEMMDDLRQNRRLRVYASETDHPILSHDEQVQFRGVHDFFGHAAEGNQFEPRGEENAFRLHSAMFSPDAQRALATETRGQNSWVNFGPHSDLPVRERPFATQKAALLPREFTEPSYPTERIAEAVSKGGATVNPQTGFGVAEGYAVADPAHTEALKAATPADIAAFMDRHAEALREPNAHIGAWIDPATGQGEINVSHVLADRNAALRLGQTRDQKSIGDLAAYARGENGDITVPARGPAILPGEQAALESTRARALPKRYQAALTTVPSAEDYASGALAGQRGANWYPDSKLASEEAFGPDARRFQAIVAALSPQNEIERNTDAALDLFTRWLDAGRPQSQAAVRQMVRAVAPLEAHRANAMRALLGPSEGAVLSGSKVEPFRLNLGGDYDPVTVDAIMGATAGIDPKMLQGTMMRGKDAFGVLTGYSGPYIAMSQRLREAARLLGYPWNPASVQAANWVFARPYLQQFTNEINPGIAAIRPVAEDVPSVATVLRDRLGTSISPPSIPAPDARTPDPAALQHILDNIARAVRGDTFRF